MVLWSAATKNIIVIELIVPWKERCSEENEWKKAKNYPLMAECRDKGWQTWSFHVEAGCREFPAQSVWRLFSVLGVTGRYRRTAIQRMGQAAEKSSCWIWLNRDNRSWKPTNDAQWIVDPHPESVPSKRSKNTARDGLGWGRRRYCSNMTSAVCT